MGKKAGSALIFVLVTMVVMGAAVTVVMGATVIQSRVSQEKDRFVKSLHDASAAIEYLKYYIKASGYATNGRNRWLANHSSDAGTVLTSVEVPELANVNATVTITSNGATHWYKIESKVPVPVSDPNVSLERVVEVWVREREPFSEYMFFVGSGHPTWGIAFGETTVGGKVHCNNRITFVEPSRNPGTNEPAKLWGETTTAEDFYRAFGGTTADLEEIFTIYNSDGSVKYVTSHEDHVDPRPMPETNDIDLLWSVGNAEGYTADDSIEFVTRQDTVTGIYTTKVILDDDGVERDLPSNGVISSNTSDVNITGTTTTNTGTTYNVAGINGRVTIVNKSNAGNAQISISTPIIYIDDNGEPYHQHRDGTDESNYVYYDYRSPYYYEAAGSDLWVGTNVEYIRNPNYQGNSAVGIVSQNDIVYGVGTATGTSMELHAAVLANGAFGHWHDGIPKRHLRIVGSLTFEDSYGRYSGSPGSGTGYSYSGSYIYDQMLRGNAPPHFLGTARPEFFAWRVVR